MHDALTRWTTRAAEETSTEGAALAVLAEAAAEPLPTAEEIRAHWPEKGVPLGLSVLLARALEAEGRQDEGADVLFALAERLNQLGYHRAMARVLAQVLPHRPAQAAPLLARARVQGGSEAVDDALLFEAQRRHSGHGHLCWLASLAHEARGEREPARRLAALALPELAADKDHETTELALLLLAEEDAPEILPALTRTLEILARQEAWDLFETATSLLDAPLTSPAGALQFWPVVREIWRKHPERERLRALGQRVLRAYLASRYPEPEALFRLSEIDRPSQPAEVVLARLERGERFPPGFYAQHSGWGMGRIRDNDTQAVVVDFPSKPLHRMTMATAQQALTVLAPGDLRVLLAVDPEGLRRLALGEPASLVVKVLEIARDHRATAEEIRKRLVPDVVSAPAWPAWWKDARNALALDPRIDHRRAYANLWSLTSAVPDDGTPIPAWDPEKNVFENLALLDTFLEQHPGEAEALRLHHAERVGVLARGERTTPEEAAAAALWLLRQDPGSPVRPESTVDASFNMNLLSRRDQEDLLPRLASAPALAAALNSRLVGVRRGARERLSAQGADPHLLRELLTRAVQAPEAALEILEAASVPGTLPSAGAEMSHALFVAALDLLEKPPREAHRKRALALLAAESPLDACLRAHPLGEDEKTSVTARLVRWQSSDRFRFPVLDFLRRIGHSDVAEAVEGARARAAARVSGRVGAESEDPYEGAPLLTRATFERLEAERQRVGLELKTVIPQAIQKAREHGDLRENAEYDAAKSKQAVYAKRFAELETTLARVRLIDDLKRDPGVAAPGTQVRLREEDGPRAWTFWILGEGDQELGPEVVSYRAPLGKRLLGVRTGDRVDLPRDEVSVPCRVESVEERLPPA